MPSQRIMVTLTDEQVDRLSEVTERSAMSKSGVISLALTEWLDRHEPSDERPTDGQPYPMADSVARALGRANRYMELALGDMGFTVSPADWGTYQQRPGLGFVRLSQQFNPRATPEMRQRVAELVKDVPREAITTRFVTMEAQGAYTLANIQFDGKTAE